jgi:hypothetical protein
MSKKYLCLLLLLCGFLPMPSCWAITEAYAASNEIYNPNWSIEENGGALSFNTLAPYRRIQEKTGKVPLILIHGVISENRPYCNWSFLLDELQKPENKSFFDSHPVYIFKYASSTNNWAETSGKLKKGIEELIQDYPADTKIKIVTSSLGGNLLCAADERDSLLDKSIENVVSLGTPFWGTPLLSKKLMIDNVKPTDRVLNLLVSQVTTTLFPSLQAQLPWMLPLDKTQAQTSHSCAHLRSRVITYGGFLKSPITSNPKTTNKQVESWLLETFKNADYRHAWDASMHYKIGWEMERAFRPIYLFRFNDGLVPIYSSLWLDPNVSIFEGQTALDAKTLRQIKSVSPKARLYEGIDHTDLTSRQTSKKSHPMNDLLSGSDNSIARNIVQDLK